MRCVDEHQWLRPEWPAPANVRALTTSRRGGVSRPPYDSLNLASHVGDDPEAVRQNRATLRECLGLASEPLWLNQVHGSVVVDAARAEQGATADGSYSRVAGQACVVMTADCLPLLICNRAGTQVAAVHAGWRGLSGGALEAGLASFADDPADLLVWLGPAIGPGRFEVGPEVVAAFSAHDPGAGVAFAPQTEGKWLADIYTLARRRLALAGVDAVYGGGECTVTDAARYYSFRRDRTTGRMASLIWMV